MNKIGVVLVVLGGMSLSGCATTQKPGLDQQALHNQVSALESQLQEKDREIVSLRDALVKATEEKSSLKRSVGLPVTDIKSRPTMKEIQTALKNAGYNPGPIDGKQGKQTREAIKAFQKANNLKADGKVGKQTWVLLSEHLEQKTK